ncbi:MAG TPA: hypothetical protein VLA04_02750 [Verrucomicrobiae bacterium]|nr:hypothetical protein [Verrucomicrobiae bacterium]
MKKFLEKAGEIVGILFGLIGSILLFDAWLSHKQLEPTGYESPLRLLNLRLLNEYPTLMVVFAIVGFGFVAWSIWKLFKRK